MPATSALRTTTVASAPRICINPVTVHLLPLSVVQEACRRTAPRISRLWRARRRSLCAGTPVVRTSCAPATLRGAARALHSAGRKEVAMHKCVRSGWLLGALLWGAAAFAGDSPDYDSARSLRGLETYKTYCA